MSDLNTPAVPGEQLPTAQPATDAPVAATETTVTAPADEFELQDPEEPSPQEEAVVADTRAPANHHMKLNTRATGPADVGREALFLPNMAEADYKTMEERTPLQAVGENEKIRSWMGQTNTARYFLPRASIGQGALSRDDANWVPSVSYEGKELRGGRATPAHQAGKSYTGEAARLRIRAAAGLGTVFQQPLWHSGFWVTVKAPNEGEYLELLQQLSDEKVLLGNSTFGLLLSNTTAYTSRRLFDFFESHVYDHTLNLAANDKLGDFVKAADLPLIILAMARVIWPEGFRYERACSTNPEKCVHTVREVVSLDHFDPIDDKYLTERQRKHMTKRTRSAMSKEEVALYVDDFLKGQERTVELTSHLKVTLKSPTINEHLLSGARWIDQIQQGFPSAMELEPDQRQAYLQEQSSATEMRQYSHFVQAITAHETTYSRDNEDQVEIIEQSLDDFSGDDNIRRRFTEEVIKFQEDGLVCTTAIPGYICPNCGGEQVPDAKKRKRFPDLVAIDAYRTFFTLLLQKVQKIRNRPTYTY